MRVGWLPNTKLGVPTDVDVGGECALGYKDPMGQYIGLRKVVVDNDTQNLGQ